MKYLIYISAAALVLMASCRGDRGTPGSTADTGRLAKATEHSTAAAALSNPAIQAELITNAIELTANDRMQFSDTLFKVKTGEKISLQLTDLGNMPKNAMGHNLCCSKQVRILLPLPLKR